MKQKHSNATQKNAILSQDSEGIRDLDEQELEQVAGGIMVAEGVEPSQVAAMKAKGFYVAKAQLGPGLVMMTPFKSYAAGQ